MQHVEKRLSIREAQHVVEVLKGVFRVAAGMWPPDSSDGPLPTEKVAEGVRRMSGLSERSDEDQIDVVRQLLQQIFKTGIADEGNVMSRLSAPDADYLRHDARKIGIHDASVQSSSRTPGHDIDDPDTELSHAEIAPWSASYSIKI